jgi:lysine 6-dehydrogenase
MFTYVVLGAGRQGIALAYDLAKNCEASRITLLDSDEGAGHRGLERLRKLLHNSGVQWHTAPADVSDIRSIAPHLAGAHVVLSATPYRFNVELTDAAIAAGASFSDLGGNTAVVRSQLARHEAAKAAGVSVVPDCGLAPGLGNILAAYGLTQIDSPRRAHVRCGGLPERRVGPLGYKMLFNFQGLINEYSGFGEFLRDGKACEVRALTELEAIEFPAPIGRCEAAVTSGGTSTCAESFLGKLEAYDYKTVRYPGHFAIVRAMFELGCFEERICTPAGELAPKRTMQHLFESVLAFPEVRDITVLRTVVGGTHAGKPAELRLDLFDRHDEATGFTAMERTTAFPTTLVAHLQARKLIAPGARPLELCIPLDRYMTELPAHDIGISRSERLG